MTAILILAGLTLLLLSWFWVIWRAFLYKPFWGLAVVVLPLLPVFIVLHWRRIGLPILLLITGAVLIASGAYRLATEQPKQWQQLLSGQWQQERSLSFSVNSPDAADGRVQGELAGQGIVVERATLEGRTLALYAKGEPGMAAWLKVHLLHAPQVERGAGLYLNVLPNDPQPLPQIELHWYDYQNGRQSRQISTDYTMRLALASQPDNLLLGTFYLAIGGEEATLLNGELELPASGLRYQDGRVDLAYDHVDTLDYLIRLHSRDELGLPQLFFERTSVVNFLLSPLSVSGRLLLEQDSYPVQFELVKENGAWRVLGSNLDAVASLLAPPVKEDMQAESVEFSLAALQENAVLYLNQQMQVLTVLGNRFSGSFQGINSEGSLVFQRNMKRGDSVIFQLQAREIAEIGLQD